MLELLIWAPTAILIVFQETDSNVWPSLMYLGWSAPEIPIPTRSPVIIAVDVGVFKVHADWFNPIVH